MATLSTRFHTVRTTHCKLSCFGFVRTALFADVFVLQRIIMTQVSLNSFLVPTRRPSNILGGGKFLAAISESTMYCENKINDPHFNKAFLSSGGCLKRGETRIIVSIRQMELCVFQ